MSENTLPPPLCHDDYEDVKFWTEKAYDEYQRRNDGDTDGRLNRISDKARKIFNSLKTANMAPSSWGRMGLDVYDYFKIEMVCEFEEFRFCEGSWKLERWASRAYASWMQGVRKRNEAGHSKEKRKRSTSEDSHHSIDDSGLLKIDSDHETDTAIATFPAPLAPSPSLSSATSPALGAAMLIQSPSSDETAILAESQMWE